MTEAWLEGPATRQSAKPDHDRPTWIAYVQLAFWAWFLYAFGATQALLRDEQGTSRSVASLHGTALALGGLVGALLTARAVARWGAASSCGWPRSGRWPGCSSTPGPVRCPPYR